MTTEVKVFEAGDVVLQSGQTLKDARIVYTTYGTLAADKANVIVYPSSFAAQHTDIEWLIAPGRILDPSRYFIVIPNMFGNGLSTSPSNIDPPFDRGAYPGVTTYDNVMVQRRMMREVFGVERVKMVYGWSMGGQQAYHWAALFPQALERVCIPCSSARTSEHNKIEVARMPNARLLPIPWVWGHRAGNPWQNPADERFVATAVNEFLNA